MSPQPAVRVAWPWVLAALGACTFAWSAPMGNDLSAKTTNAELFEFHSNFWINLHDFLYATARARRGLDANREYVTRVLAENDELRTLPSLEQKQWQAAVAYYEFNLAKRDILFDRDMVTLSNQLVRLESAAELRGTELDPMLAAILDGAAPAYRRLWWPRHDAANKAWTSALQKPLALYGKDLAAEESRAFRTPWSSLPVHVDVVAYANWGGAYTTEEPAHIVVSSAAAGNQKDQALEVLFHEVLHTMDGPLLSALRMAFHAKGKALPHDPTHVFIFYTAGALTHRALPNHVPYAEKNGLWERVPDFKRALPVLRQFWQPYLDGRITFDEAVAGYAGAL